MWFKMNIKLIVVLVLKKLCFATHKESSTLAEYLRVSGEYHRGNNVKDKYWMVLD